MEIVVSFLLDYNERMLIMLFVEGIHVETEMLQKCRRDAGKNLFST
jgi:hypothetical protein